MHKAAAHAPNARDARPATRPSLLRAFNVGALVTYDERGAAEESPRLAKARTLRTVAIALAVVASGVLVYGFGMKWSAEYQVAAGAFAYIGIEWQRHIGKKIKQLEGS